MTRQIGAHYQEPSGTGLEERVHHLEAKVTVLTDALRVLARGLEDGPLAEPGDRTVVSAARQAHEMLIAADSPPPAGEQ
ncbi:MAG TPA: hypothetical protein VMV17_15910 [Streptosporangiaceae bacterium]|nr:hypothetical protein [Streptosporangiaceae bacterium]